MVEPDKRDDNERAEAGGGNQSSEVVHSDSQDSEDEGADDAQQQDESGREKACNRVEGAESSGDSLLAERDWINAWLRGRR